MKFVIDPEVVVTNLHSLCEQNNSRLTFKQAVYALAEKGIVLPGKTNKEQIQILTALINLCEPSFLDARPGRNGGVGMPSMRSAKATKAAKARSAVLATMMRDSAEEHEPEEADQDEDIELTGT